jgi:hypothetical protein
MLIIGLPATRTRAHGKGSVGERSIMEAAAEILSAIQEKME